MSSSGASSPERKRKYVKSQAKAELATSFPSSPPLWSTSIKTSVIQANGRAGESTSAVRTRRTRLRLGNASKTETQASLAMVATSPKSSEPTPTGSAQNTTKLSKAQNNLQSPNLNEFKPSAETLLEAEEKTEKKRLTRRNKSTPYKQLKGNIQAESSVLKSPQINGHEACISNSVAKRGPGRKPREVKSLTKGPGKKRGRKSKQELLRSQQENEMKRMAETKKDLSNANGEAATSESSSHSENNTQRESVPPKPRRGRKPKAKNLPAKPKLIVAAKGKMRTRSNSRKHEDPTEPMESMNPVEPVVEEEEEERTEEAKSSKSIMKTRNQGRRTTCYNEEDSEEEQRQLLFEDSTLTFGTSSRGRLRKLTEKAKANLIGW